MSNKKYLIFAETGGETGSPYRSYMHYHICEGSTIEEALKQWHKHVVEWVREITNNPNYNSEPEFKCNNGVWTDCGRYIQIVELKEDEGYDDWKELKWCERK
jgi:hypothetical protein